MPFQATEKLVDANRSEISKKVRQADRLGIDQPDHVDWINVIAPNHGTAGRRSPGKTLFPQGNLPVP